MTPTVIARFIWIGRKTRHDLGPRYGPPPECRPRSGRRRAADSSGNPRGLRGSRESHGDHSSGRPKDDDPVRPLSRGRHPTLAGSEQLRPPGDRLGDPQGQGLLVREFRARPGRAPGHLAGSRDRGWRELFAAPTAPPARSMGALSHDGDHWTPLAPIVAKLEDRVEIGIVAVNSSSKPLKAEFEGFAVSEGPGGVSDSRTSRIDLRPSMNGERTPRSSRQVSASTRNSWRPWRLGGSIRLRLAWLATASILPDALRRGGSGDLRKEFCDNAPRSSAPIAGVREGRSHVEDRTESRYR